MWEDILGEGLACMHAWMGYTETGDRPPRASRFMSVVNVFLDCGLEERVEGR